MSVRSLGYKSEKQLYLHLNDLDKVHTRADTAAIMA